MADFEKALGKEVSRRGFMKATGVGIGLAAGALVFGTSIVGAQTQSAPSGTIPEAPMPFVPLDPAEARLRGHAGYYKAGCAYGGFSAILSMLREKVGGPFNQIPLRMLGYGRAGVGNWGTLCGALNGACAAINLVAPDADVNKMAAELLGWYGKQAFPSAEATAIAMAGGFRFTEKKDYPRIDLVTSVSDSPLCHVSNAKWIATSGFKLPSAERKERCARLTGDVAAKAAEILNAWKAGTFKPEFVLDAATATCLSCHDGDQEGKMTCLTCHDGKH
ncbi:MAG: C-GCAxxG-C-C family protein [Rectinemataceae bacterium]|nr:C-GCAxxG-C-C family protein [Rectinemataceae bacterium]